MSEEIKTKWCPFGEHERPITEFARARSRKTGLQSYCNNCLAHYRREGTAERTQRNEERRLQSEKDRAAGTRRCLGCDKIKPFASFHAAADKKLGVREQCRVCVNLRISKSPTIKVREKLRRVKLRAEVLEAYGGKCRCCGENTPEFLGIDHILKNGSKERAQYGAGSAFYHHLKREGFPQDRYQLLCHNCNMAKGFYGDCPHQRKIKA